jgi:hypothetical protein
MFNPSGLEARGSDGIGVGTPITIFSGSSNAGGYRSLFIRQTVANPNLRVVSVA